MSKISLRAQLWSAALGGWLAGGVAVLAIATSGDEYRLLGAAFLLVAVLLMWLRPLSLVPDAAPIVAGLLWALILVARANADDLEVGREAVIPAVVMLVALAGAWALSQLQRGAHQAIATELKTRGNAIRELSRFDLATGALQPRYGHQVLSEEIERSRRYHHTLTLVMLGADAWEQVVASQGQAESRRILRRIADMLNAALRTTDKLVRHDDGVFALILPETPVQGATILAERLADAIQRDTDLAIRLGLAEFPEDAVSTDDLINEAEQALEFARISQLRVASRALLS